MSNFVLVNYYEDFGRMGNLEGTFICKKEELDSLKGVEVCFGEVLGKHSEVYTKKAYENCIIKPTTKDQINLMIEVFGEGTISGYNPLEYLEDE